MKTLLDLRAAMVKGIHDRIPDLKSCETHPGRFDLDELRTIATRTPALRLAILSVDRVAEIGNGETDWAVRFATFIVTLDQNKLRRDDAALNLVEGFLAILPGQAWGQDNVHPLLPSEISGAQNLYSNRLSQHAVSIWAVTFTQRIRLGTDILATDGTLPRDLYIGQSPKIGKAFEGDYIKGHAHA
ncbi:MAG: hypothetical protein AAF442_04995 [Pseudomonadota bacterium]